MSDGSGGAGLGELAIRLAGSLALVVGLLLLIARTVNKRFKAPAGATIQVVARQAIGRGQGLAVVAVGTRVLVVGTTEQQVTLLAEVEPDEVGLDLTAGLADFDGAEGIDAEDADIEDAETEDADAQGQSAGNTRRPVGVPRTIPKPNANALAGSVLSPQTWKDAMAAVTGKRAS